MDAAGYHPLSSLVAFADVGDQVRWVPDGQKLTVTGPFAHEVPTGPDNLIERAMAQLSAATDRGLGGGWHLDKQLPVASGVGGGSADAGAALRLAAQRLGLAVDDPAVVAAARSIGADGPMCLASQTAWTEGYGEMLMPEPRLPPLPCVLVNPGVPSPTGAVYRAYDEAPVGSADRPAPPPDWSVSSIIAWLAVQRNDLQAPAIALEPRIAGVLEAVAATPKVALARMSGSGATVFGLCASQGEAEAAATALSVRYPDWWIRACTLGNRESP